MRRALVAVGLLLAVLLGGCANSTPRKPIVAPRDDAAWVLPITSHEASLCISTDCGVDGAALHWSLGTWAHTTTGYFIYVTTMTLGQQVADVHTSPWVIGGADCGTSVLLGVRQHDGSGDVGPLYSTTYTTPACSSSSTTTSSTTSSTTTSSTTSGGGGGPGTQPVGDPQGITWNLAFDDEMNGTSIDTTKWEVYNDPQTGCPGTAAVCHIAHDNEASTAKTTNCTEGSVNPGGLGTVGAITLTAPNDGTGCNISSAWGGAGSYNGTELTNSTSAFELGIGDYVEFRVWVPPCPGCDNGFAPVANHETIWTSGANWPANGEIDIAEGLSSLSTTYHKCNVTPPVVGCGNTQDTTTFPAPSSAWPGSWHIYGTYRTATDDYVYWDGNLVATHVVSDLGGLQALRMDIGYSSGGANFDVTPANMYVDWCRAYTQ